MANIFLRPPLDRIVNVHWGAETPIGISALWIALTDLEDGTYEGSSSCSPINEIVVNPIMVGTYTLSWRLSLFGPTVSSGVVISGAPVISPMLLEWGEWEVNAPFIDPFESDGPLEASFSIKGQQGTSGFKCIGNPAQSPFGLKGMIVEDAGLAAGVVNCSGITATHNGVGWRAYRASIASAGGLSISVDFARD